MNTDYPFKREWIALGALLLLFVAAIAPSLPGLDYDMECWRHWAEHLGARGVGQAYDLPGNNYPPLYQYILWMYAKLNGDVESIRRNIGYLRIFTLLFEYWGLWLVWKWLDRRPDFGYLLVCSMLNVAYSYNMLLWGQVDGIVAALVFAAFYFLYRRQLVLSAVMLVLALNMKLQAIIFLPLWGLLMLSALQRGRKWRLFPLLILVMAGVQGLVLLPFAFGPGGLRRVWQVILDLTDYYPFLSMNAYNIWYWIARNAGPGAHDTIRILGVTAKQLGLIAFCSASFVAMLPVLLDTLRAVRDHSSKPIDKERIWLGAALVAMAFFFFNTQMHERYAHPAFIFVTAYAFQRKQFGLYALFSVAYLLNLEAQARAFHFMNYDTLIFRPRFVSALYGAFMLWACVLLYRKHRALAA